MTVSTSCETSCGHHWLGAPAEGLLVALVHPLLCLALSTFHRFCFLTPSQLCRESKLEDLDLIVQLCMTA